MNNTDYKKLKPALITLIPISKIISTSTKPSIDMDKTTTTKQSKLIFTPSMMIITIMKKRRNLNFLFPLKILMNTSRNSSLL